MRNLTICFFTIIMMFAFVDEIKSQTYEGSNNKFKYIMYPVSYSGIGGTCYTLYISVTPKNGNSGFSGYLMMSSKDYSSRDRFYIAKDKTGYVLRNNRPSILDELDNYIENEVYPSSISGNSNNKGYCMTEQYVKNLGQQLKYKFNNY